MIDSIDVIYHLDLETLDSKLFRSLRRIHYVSRIHWPMTRAQASSQNRKFVIMVQTAVSSATRNIRLLTDSEKKKISRSKCMQDNHYGRLLPENSHQMFLRASESHTRACSSWHRLNPPIEIRRRPQLRVGRWLVQRRSR